MGPGAHAVVDRLHDVAGIGSEERFHPGSVHGRDVEVHVTGAGRGGPALPPRGLAIRLCAQGVAAAGTIISPRWTFASVSPGSDQAPTAKLGIAAAAAATVACPASAGPAAAGPISGDRKPKMPAKVSAAEAMIDLTIAAPCVASDVAAPGFLGARAGGHAGDRGGGLGDFAGLMGGDAGEPVGDEPDLGLHVALDDRIAVARAAWATVCWPCSTAKVLLVSVAPICS